jgi:Pyruvate/2-oxoacid:ferredoxin oxidoreductase gamma subunit
VSLKSLEISVEDAFAGKKNLIPVNLAAVRKGFDFLEEGK